MDKEEKGKKKKKKKNGFLFLDHMTVINLSK